MDLLAPTALAQLTDVQLGWIDHSAHLFLQGKGIDVGKDGDVDLLRELLSEFLGFIKTENE